MLFGHLIRMDESADARRILTAVPQSDCRRPVGRPHSSWMATLKNDLSLHNLTYEDAIEMALDKPLWGLLAASGATHWWCVPNNDDDDDVYHSLLAIISVEIFALSVLLIIQLENTRLQFRLKVCWRPSALLGNIVRHGDIRVSQFNISLYCVCTFCIREPGLWSYELSWSIEEPFRE